MTVELKSKQPGSADLHYKLNILMVFIRIGGLLIAIIYNWTNRNNFVNTLNCCQRFRQYFLQKWKKREIYEKYLERGIRIKCQHGLLADVLLFISSLEVFYNTFEIKNPCILILLSLLPTVLNVVMTHYYLSILNVNIFLSLINEEVKRIINSSAKLYQEQIMKRIKVIDFIYHCSQLSAQLDDLAKDHFNLQQLVRHINGMYDIQITCIMMALYFHNICVIYMFYLITHHESVWRRYGEWPIYLLPITLFIYYSDLKVFTFAMLNLEDRYKQTSQLLKARPNWLSHLDKKLEKSFKKFSLQLASFPVKMKLVGLFNMDRPMAYAIFSSTIAHAIVLMQYDFKYTKK